MSPYEAGLTDAVALVARVVLDDDDAQVRALITEILSGDYAAESMLALANSVSAGLHQRAADAAVSVEDALDWLAGAVAESVWSDMTEEADT